MKEDKNMKKANDLTLLRAKQEYRRKMQAKQQQQKNEVKVVKPVEVKIEQPAVEESTNKKRQGHKQSATSKEKIKQSLMGHKHSETTIAKMKKIRLEKYARSVTCVTTGETFDSVKSAAQHYGIYDTNIVRCCKGKSKTTGKLNGQPLEWAYTEDYLNNK